MPAGIPLTIRDFEHLVDGEANFLILHDHMTTDQHRNWAYKRTIPALLKLYVFSVATII